MTTATDDSAARDAFLERMFHASIAANDLYHMYLGDRLGLYAALVEHGPLGPEELAGTAGIAPRYAQEWLEQQAVAGVLEVETGRSQQRRYRLPAAHAEVLLDPESLAHFPAALAAVGIARVLPLLVEAFRTGQGIAYEAYGDDVRRFISQVNRPMFLHLLADEWFRAVPGLTERLDADAPARVLDVGCGTGWSSIAIARRFPKATVVGLDLDEASIVEARRSADEVGVGDRVSFVVADAADPSVDGEFDLVCAFETIHDMNDPVGALVAMRARVATGGYVLVADERVADEFTTEVEDGERFQWGFSALHCLPTALTEPPAAGTGTIMRTPILRDYAQAAGFTDLTVLPIENDFWRFYLLEGTS